MAGASTCTCRPSRKESVLSLDGGGIRGYATLLILQSIMEECLQLEYAYDEAYHQSSPDDEQLPLPCHYFDYMFGTSTGGIIAIMLGRLRMSVDGCIEVYKKFGREIFGNKRKLWFLRYNKFNYKKVEAFMQDMVVKHCKDAKKEDSPLLRNPADEQPNHYIPCRVGVFAVRQAENQKLYLLRSYHNPRSPNLREDLGRLLNLTHQLDTELWKAARATCAAPTYFSPMRIDGGYFMDGGLEANNPANWAWNEASVMHKHNPAGDCSSTRGGIRHLVSIGTGKRAERHFNVRADRIRRGIGLVRQSLNQMTDPEPTHNSMKTVAENFTDDVYFRFNVERGLEDMKLDEFVVVNGMDMTLRTIEDKVAVYIRENRDQFKKLAKRLVDHRRQRCKPGYGRKYHHSLLSRPGPLDENLREFFRWDESAAESQHDSSQELDPRQKEPAVAGASELSNGRLSHGHEMSNGHLAHSHEMPASPIENWSQHFERPLASPQEVASASSPHLMQSTKSSPQMYTPSGRPSAVDTSMSASAPALPFQPPQIGGSEFFRVQSVSDWD
ncbi:hypothetical protein AAFC00_006034 [Neodothiora populina]|uniref:PNPLA domain-containing protein n=1 Tax=Neodothiora populina TaxID=2781224 RepID=A0ABR3P744_9PEZI